LLDEDLSVKIADLALSKDPNATKTAALVGTPGMHNNSLRWIIASFVVAAYMSPELLRDGALSPEADVWAFGIIAYECICQHRVYPDMRPMSMMQKIANEGLKPVFPQEMKEDATRPAWLPKGLVALIETCQASDPKERPSFKSICNKLKQL